MIVRIQNMTVRTTPKTTRKHLLKSVLEMLDHTGHTKPGLRNTVQRVTNCRAWTLDAAAVSHGSFSFLLANPSKHLLPCSLKGIPIRSNPFYTREAFLSYGRQSRAAATSSIFFCCQICQDSILLAILKRNSD